MVAFPGEGEEEFAGTARFCLVHRNSTVWELLRLFEEDDTWAAKNLKGPDSEETKAKRLDLLMEEQMTIYEEKMLRCMAKKSLLLVDETEGDTRICRSQWDSPKLT